MEDFPASHASFSGFYILAISKKKRNITPGQLFIHFLLSSTQKQPLFLGGFATGLALDANGKKFEQKTSWWLNKFYHFHR